MSKPILLMNHTLLSKRAWCQTAPDSTIKGTDETWKQKAYRELVETLCRNPYESNIYATQGIKFENQVYRDAIKIPETVTGSQDYLSVVNTVRGGIFQKFVTLDTELEDVILRWYGILDVKLPGRIIDIKTTGKFKPSKYLESGQDKLYRWLTKIPKFDYLIAEWSQFPGINQVALLTVPEQSMESLEEDLMREAREFLQWLKDLGYYELFVECYCHLGRGWKSMIARKGPDQADKLEEFYAPYREKYLKQFRTGEEAF